MTYLGPTTCPALPGISPTEVDGSTAEIPRTYPPYTLRVDTAHLPRFTPRCASQTRYRRLGSTLPTIDLGRCGVGALLPSDHITCPGHRPDACVSGEATCQSRKHTRPPYIRFQRDTAVTQICWCLRQASSPRPCRVTLSDVNRDGIPSNTVRRSSRGLIPLGSCSVDRARVWRSGHLFQRGATGSPVLPSEWANNGSDQAITCRLLCF